MIGHGMNQRQVTDACDLLGQDWNSLGILVRARTLDAVARHFLDLGLTELCVEALCGELPASRAHTWESGDKFQDIDG